MSCNRFPWFFTVAAVLAAAAGAFAAGYQIKGFAGVDTRSVLDVPLEFGGEFDADFGVWKFEGAFAYAPGDDGGDPHGALYEDSWKRYLWDGRGGAAFAPGAGPAWFGGEYRFTRTAYCTHSAAWIGDANTTLDDDTYFDRHRILAAAGYRWPLASWLAVGARAGAGIAFLTQDTLRTYKEFESGDERTVTSSKTFGDVWLPAWSGGVMFDFRRNARFGVAAGATVLGTVGKLEDESRDQVDVVGGICPYIAL
jgi:hypothetical protein